MWDVRACRSCLAVKGKLEKIGEAFKRHYTAITGLVISDDGYPAYFCMECRHQIKKSLTFRRKSRRAHFVLKEIMAVRKQISYSDIVIVNRKKTNLESTLNYWEPKNSACYLIDNQEREEGEQKNDLAPLTLNYTKAYSTHLVNIEPDLPEPEPEPEPPVEQNEPNEENDFNEDNPTNDYIDTDMDTTNIDMNDIFKDLPIDEPEPSDNEIEPLPLPPVTVRSLKHKKNRDVLGKLEGTLKNLHEFFYLYDMRVLSLDEQKKRFEDRKKQPPFVYAHYKCGVCLTVHANMTELLEHVKFHNKRKFDFECKVCKNKLPTADDLNAHMANYHMYEYECRLCKQANVWPCSAKFYSQADAVKHVRKKHSHRDPQSREKRQNHRVTVKVAEALTMFSLTPVTQEMMREVMNMRLTAQATEPKRTFNRPKNKNWYICDICGIFVKRKEHLEKHMTMKHRFMYTCKFCKEVFTSRNEAVEHSTTHAGPRECKDCGKKFSNPHELKSHRKETHLQLQPTPCNLCGYTAKHIRLLIKHQLRQHGFVSLNDPMTGNPQYKCEECSVQFIDQWSLQKHLVNMNHKGADTVECACIPCKKVFKDAEELETHYITCIYGRKYPRNCCYCPEVLNSPSEYKSHYFRQHPSLPYRYISNNCICDVCGKSVLKNALEGHMKSHSQSDGLFSCRLCGVTSATPARHVAHVINGHSRRPYLCTLCSGRFISRCNLKRHILKVHKPLNLYKCDFCGKEFSYFKNLKDHSKSMHDLVLPNVKSKFAMHSRFKIYVYAHMKIEINELERPIVEKTSVELVDYIELKSKPVDYKNYFVFNPDVEETTYVMKKDHVRKFQRKKKVEQTELETAVAQIKYEEPNESINETANDLEYEQIQIKDMKDEMEVDSGIKTNETQMKLEIEKMESMEVNQLELSQDDSVCTEVGVVEENAIPLEVIESDGHQYVMIDGEMYRIACEDEV